MKKLLLIALFLVVSFSLLAFSKYYSEMDTAKQEVQSLIEGAYINGAFNKLDTKTMKAGFHPDFAIFSAKGEEISKYPIATWIEGIEKRKAKDDFDPSKQKWDHHFASIDVTGGSAAAKVELSKEGKLVYTDYLSLLKFDSGWKIVAKVYHKHTD